MFLNILIKAVRPRLIVEAGTSYGYSSLWLADAAHETGSRVLSLEISESKIEFTRRQLEEAGLDAAVEFVHGDAIAGIALLAEEVDFALIDLLKDLYIPAVDTLYPKLSSGALIAADNICLPALHTKKPQFPTLRLAKVPLSLVGLGVELNQGRRAGADRRQRQGLRGSGAGLGHDPVGPVDELIDAPQLLWRAGECGNCFYRSIC